MKFLIRYPTLTSVDKYGYFETEEQHKMSTNIHLVLPNWLGLVTFAFAKLMSLRPRDRLNSQEVQLGFRFNPTDGIKAIFIINFIDLPTSQ